MSVNRFEELEAWKLARTLNGLIYGVSGTGDFSRDFALRDQIRRAAISVVSNIAEDSNVTVTRNSFSFSSWPRVRAAK